MRYSSADRGGRAGDRRLVPAPCRPAAGIVVQRWGWAARMILALAGLAACPLGARPQEAAAPQAPSRPAVPPAVAVPAGESGPAGQQGTAGQQGAVGQQRYMPRAGCEPRIGRQAVPLADLPVPWLIRHRDGDWLWVGAAWVRREQVVPLSEASAYYSGLLRERPEDGWAYVSRGVVAYHQGRFEEALRDYQRAVEVAPEEATVFGNRGRTLYAVGRVDEALRDFDRAIRLSPGTAAHYYNRGVAWEAKSRFDRALADYTEAIRLRPDDPDAWNNRAWLEATCPLEAYRNADSAVADARRAGELVGWGTPDAHDTLAAALASAGKFSEAVVAQQRALQLEPRLPGGSQRLRLYQQQRPFREAPPAGSAGQSRVGSTPGR